MKCLTNIAVGHSGGLLEPGAISMIELLISRGANVNSYFPSVGSPLLIAAEYIDKQVVKIANNQEMWT